MRLPWSARFQVRRMTECVDCHVRLTLIGLIRLDFGAPHASTAHRAQGFELGIVAILEKPGDIQVYAEHPAHQKCVCLASLILL